MTNPTSSKSPLQTQTLYDSYTNESLTAEDLGISDAAYEHLVGESMSTEQPEGHVRVGGHGRRVYAQ